MFIINSTKSTTLATNGSIANTFPSRLIGLLNRKALQEGEALVITKCNSIHTFFMRFVIDIVFLKTQIHTDKVTDAHRLSAIVVKTVPALLPFRLVFCLRADKVIELPAGTVARTKTQAGDVIEL